MPNPEAVRRRGGEELGWGPLGSSVGLGFARSEAGPVTAAAERSQQGQPPGVLEGGLIYPCHMGTLEKSPYLPPPHKLRKRRVRLVPGS